MYYVTAVSHHHLSPDSPGSPEIDDVELLLGLVEVAPDGVLVQQVQVVHSGRRRRSRDSGTGPGSGWDGWWTRANSVVKSRNLGHAFLTTIYFFKNILRPPFMGYI